MIQCLFFIPSVTHVLHQMKRVEDQSLRTDSRRTPRSNDTNLVEDRYGLSLNVLKSCPCPMFCQAMHSDLINSSLFYTRRRSGSHPWSSTESWLDDTVNSKSRRYVECPQTHLRTQSHAISLLLTFTYTLPQFKIKSMHQTCPF